MSARARRDEASESWFDGLAEGRLMIRRCGLCGRHSRPDARTCPECFSSDLDWTEASGGATVISVIVDHTRAGPVVLGLVELDEGPWLHVGLTSGTQAGRRVRLAVVTPEGSEPIPGFVPRC